MGNKAKKIVSIIIISLLVALAIYVLVSFIINKDGTMYWINYFVELLNKPLPIVGITASAVLVFLWQVIINSNYGKAKLTEYDNKQKALELEHEKLINDANSKINELITQNDELRAQLSYACSLSTNKKINDFGKALEDGKENENSDTTKE